MRDRGLPATGPSGRPAPRHRGRRTGCAARSAALALLIVAGLGVTVRAAPPPAPVPRTGQARCYRTSGSAVAGCAGTGQDGETQAGAPWPEPRFIDGGDRTITDRLTGLVWARDAGLAGEPATWTEALGLVKALEGGSPPGGERWRLPNVNELLSLVNAQPDLAGWLQAQGFRNLRVDYYWTSTTYAPHPGYAWAVSLFGGIAAAQGKAERRHVWPVRGGGPGTVSLPKTGQGSCSDRSGAAVACPGTGQDGETQAGVPWPEPRFVENPDGTIFDSLTGLAWTKHGMAPGPEACRPGVPKILQGALDLVRCLNANGYLGRTDWRLPNRNELASLVNRGLADTAAWLNSVGFSGVQPSSYWSSSSFDPAPSNGWSVNLHDGAVTTHAKTHDINVWPVRGGERRR